PKASWIETTGCNRSAGTVVDRVRVQVVLDTTEVEDPEAHVAGGNAALDVGRADEAAAFVVDEEEGLVFPDRTTHAATEAVVAESGILAVGRITVPGVGVQDVVLQIFVRGAVISVAAAAGDHLDFAASGTREAGARIGGDDAKFLEAFNRSGHDGAR